MGDPTAARAARAWNWRLSDPDRRIFVGGVWAALVAVTAWCVGLYARNWPVNDEWAFVNDFLGRERPASEWIFERHADHRYPLARATLVLLDRTCGHDCRNAIWANVLFLAAASGFLILAPRRMRGAAEFTDCLFPTLLLHRGHCEDLLMGYQIAFTLNEFWIAAFLLALSGARARPWPAALAVAGLAGGGGAGILFALPLGSVLLWIIARRRAGVGPAVLTASALACALLQLADSIRHPTLFPRNGAAATAKVFLQTAAGAFGRATADDSPDAGPFVGPLVLLAAAVAAAAAAAALATTMIRQNWGLGIQYGDKHARAYDDADDARRGLPIDLLAERNICFFPGHDSSARAWEALRVAGVAPFADARPSGGVWRTVAGSLRAEPGGTRWRIAPPEVPGARALRIRGTRPDLIQWAFAGFSWTEIAPDGRETPRSEYRRAWGSGGAWPAVLWIDGPIRDAVFECEGSDRPVSAEWLSAPDGGISTSR